MLYAIRRDLQAGRLADGSAVRCYLPYGGHVVGYVLGSLRRFLGAVARRGLRRPGRGARGAA